MLVFHNNGDVFGDPLRLTPHSQKVGFRDSGLGFAEEDWGSRFVLRTPNSQIPNPAGTGVPEFGSGRRGTANWRWGAARWVDLRNDRHRWGDSASEPLDGYSCGKSERINRGS